MRDKGAPFEIETADQIATAQVTAMEDVMEDLFDCCGGTIPCVSRF